MLRNNSRFVTTNRLNDDNGDEYDIEENTSRTCDHQVFTDKHLLNELLDLIENGGDSVEEDFTDFDIRYVKAVAECCDGKKLPDGRLVSDNKIRAAMRLTKEEYNSFTKLVNEFREKIKRLRHKI